mmetsp:Transcript_82134/g.163613  ORF Transcript_82134/g.163613 Transcript_82134/m.163613 type:complete len:347 (-) Transcript_82134:415-1455(-)
MVQSPTVARVQTRGTLAEKPKKVREVPEAVQTPMMRAALKTVDTVTIAGTTASSSCQPDSAEAEGVDLDGITRFMRAIVSAVKQPMPPNTPAATRKNSRARVSDNAGPLRVRVRIASRTNAPHAAQQRTRARPGRWSCSRRLLMPRMVAAAQVSAPINAKSKERPARLSLEVRASEIGEPLMAVAMVTYAEAEGVKRGARRGEKVAAAGMAKRRGTKVAVRSSREVEWARPKKEMANRPGVERVSSAEARKELLPEAEVVEVVGADNTKRALAAVTMAARTLARPSAASTTRNPRLVPPSRYGAAMPGARASPMRTARPSSQPTARATVDPRLSSGSDPESLSFLT